jgi:hypothetical protein
MVSWGNLWQRGFGWKAAVGSKAGKNPADGTTGFAGDGDGLNDKITRSILDASQA